MRLVLILFVMFGVCGVCAAEPQCDASLPATLNKAVVSIEIPVAKQPANVPEGFVNVYRGTAWFINPHTLVTIGHVVDGTVLSRNEWKEIFLMWSDGRDKEATRTLAVNARIQVRAVGDSRLEPNIVIELDKDVPGVSALQIREEPLMRDEPVVAIGYTRGILRFVTGRLALPQPSTDPQDSNAPQPPPYLPFELVDQDKKNGVGDRYAIDNGASGGPIADCNGKVAATIVAFSKRSFTLGLAGMEPLIITTPWGEANVTGNPATPVLEIK